MTASRFRPRMRLQLLLLLLAALALTLGEAVHEILVVQNSVLGIGALHPALDGMVLWKACNQVGYATTRVTSAAVQQGVEEAMANAGATRAYLGGRYPDGGRDLAWEWMQDDWGGDPYPFCLGYLNCQPLMYTNWAPGYPADSAALSTNSHWLLQENDNGGWCNRQGLALTTYYISCSRGDTYVPTPDPTVPSRQPGGSTREPGGIEIKSEDSGFPTWAVAVIIVGAVVVLAIIIIPTVVYFCCCSNHEEQARSVAASLAGDDADFDDDDDDMDDDDDGDFSSHSGSGEMKQGEVDGERMDNRSFSSRS